MCPSYSYNYLRLLSFTKQLASHVNQGRHHQALTLFHHMQTSPALTLDPFVFPLVLKSCAAINHPQLGISIHAHAAKSSLLSNPFVACSLVDMYGKCVSISLARKLFDEIPHRNVVVWNAMISLYTHAGLVNEALRLVEGMDVRPNESSFNSIIAGLSGMEEGSFSAVQFYRRMEEWGLKPNLITLLALLPACVGLAALNLIREIHGYSIRIDIDPHPHLQSGLVEAYGRCGCLTYASYVFHSMKARDVVAWSSLISAFALHGEARTALGIFRQMEMAKVWPDDITFLGVLKACSHTGLADEALDYFDRMQKDYGVQASTEHYSCLVDALSRAGRLNDAYRVIREMPVKATAKAWGALLGACRTYGNVDIAEIAGRALFEIEPDNPANFVLLARIYASVGRHEEAQRMRSEMNERGVKAAPGNEQLLWLGT
ncbi:PPR domain-containing protein/PPR_2 domain-containing protein/PPR_3 domain-containing protein [Cephalotus follicularis]|uniref:PPR domain-containing protein/PPR_2 domain-containing protein/PPR_3 domain-containing protein n=1 Tax=Cephalotus follicularis TaxID=3775 RepID=A0A1Q3BMC4_CEPFO|nr:PPR domain-containing protein/PPR_2 domain-containing protein/PPR_3 domain-containing protein [Cephalotus follicularis]